MKFMRFIKRLNKALEKNEQGTSYYRGKVSGIIVPTRKGTDLKITEHPFFGMLSQDDEPELDDLNDLRKLRY